MTDLRLLFGACAALLIIAIPAAAADAAVPCPKISAPLTGDKAGITDFNQDQPEGGKLEGDRIRFPGHFYKTTEAIKIVVRGNSYVVGPDSIFKFSCYGRSKADKKLKPALDLLRGSVKVKTSAAAPGGVITEEGLYDPREDPTITYTVTRALSMMGEPSLEDILEWFTSQADQPTGTTNVASTGSTVGVTPYVGSRPGSCRYVHRARLTTKGRYGRGTARYTP